MADAGRRIGRERPAGGLGAGGQRGIDRERVVAAVAVAGLDDHGIDAEGRRPGEALRRRAAVEVGDGDRPAVLGHGAVAEVGALELELVPVLAAGVGPFDVVARRVAGQVRILEGRDGRDRIGTEGRAGDAGREQRHGRDGQHDQPGQPSCEAVAVTRLRSRVEHVASPRAGRHVASDWMSPLFSGGLRGPCTEWRVADSRMAASPRSSTVGCPRPHPTGIHRPSSPDTVALTHHNGPVKAGTVGSPCAGTMGGSHDAVPRWRPRPLDRRHAPQPGPRRGRARLGRRDRIRRACRPCPMTSAGRRSRWSGRRIRSTAISRRTWR